MKTLCTIWLMVGWLAAIRAQAPALIKSIPGNYVSVSIDNLDQIYLLSAGSQLKKLSPQGDSLAVFNEIKKFGEATLVDVSNPVKILLYSKGFATIVVLDGMLNIRQTIDLRRRQLFNVNAVALSYDGRIWVYDNLSNTLKKLDEEGQTIFETSDFRQLFDRAINPVGIYDQNRLVYIYDSLQGIYVFDYYGSYKSRIPVQGWQHLRVAGKYIYGSIGNQYCRYQTDTHKLECRPLTETLAGYRQVIYRGQKLYALSATGLEIYKRDPGSGDTGW